MRSAPSAALSGRVGHGRECASEWGGDLRVALVGRLDARGALDALLGTGGQSDEALVAAAYLRFGTDALARIQGDFTIALSDGEKRTLILARDPGGASPLYVRRTGLETTYALELDDLRRASPSEALDLDSLRHFVRHGLWPDAQKTPDPAIEMVPAGWYFAVRDTGRTDRRAFWTYTPYSVPRVLAAPVAREALASALAGAIRHSGVSSETVIAGDPVTTGVLARCVPATSLRLHRPRSSDAALLEEAARAAEHPLPMSVLERIAGTVAASRADVVSDLGAHALFGATPTALAALIRSLAGRFEATVSPRGLLELLRHGRRFDRAIGGPGPTRQALASIARVLVRWSRVDPGVTLAGPARDDGPATPPSKAALARLARAAELAERHLIGDEPPAPFPSVAGEPFVDRRFAEVRDRAQEAERHALAVMLGRRGLRLSAPFLAPEVVELVFSISAEHAIAKGRLMPLLDGGCPPGEIEPPAASPAALDLALRSARTLGLETSSPGPTVDRAARAQRVDRLAGVQVFLEAWGRPGAS